MRLTAVATVLGILAAGCGSTSNPPSEEALKELASEAASMTPEAFMDVTHGGGTVSLDGEGNEPLTLVLLTHLLQRGPDAATASQPISYGSGGAAPNPAHLAEALFPGRSAAYASFIRSDYVTELTQKVGQGEVTGVVSFEAPGVYSGSVRYVARRSNGGWRVEELSIPAGGIRVVLTGDGTWKRRTPAPGSSG